LFIHRHGQEEKRTAVGSYGILFPLLSLLILAFISSKEQAEPSVFSRPGVEQAYDRAQWDGLVEQVDDVKRARDMIAPYGQRYVDQLAVDYLALDDKKQLPALVERITAAAAKDRAGRDAYIGQVPEFDKLVGRYFETPTGKLVVFRNGEALAEIHGQVLPFADAGEFRRQAGKYEDVWHEVTDVAEKADFVQVFGSMQITDGSGGPSYDRAKWDALVEHDERRETRTGQRCAVREAICRPPCRGLSGTQRQRSAIRHCREGNGCCDEGPCR
jgi:hypothetical protein